MNKEIIAFKREMEKNIATLPIVKIRNAEDLALAKAALARIGDAQRAVKEKKESITKPLLEALKSTRALFGEFELKLSQMELATKAELGLYKERMEAVAQKKIAKIETKATEGELDFAKAGEKIEKIQTDISSIVKTRTHREVEITDEKKIPDEYWVIDMVKLRKDVLGGTKVAGARIVEKEIITK